MKRTMLIMAISLAILGCREEKKEQIHLGDYNHPDTATTKAISADSTKPAETKVKDSVAVDSTKVPLGSEQKETE